MPPSRGHDLVLLLVILILQLLSATLAQTTASQTIVTSLNPSSSSLSSSASSTPTVQVVEVASGNTFAYHPNVIKAALGTVISFRFYPKDHSVIRGAYTDGDDCGPSGCNPCVPWELIHPDQKDKGFHSGTILTDVNWSPGNASTVFNYTVRDENPIWFYCDAPSSCAGRGMVGVINPLDSQSIDKQSDIAATKAKIELSPGQSWPFKDVPAGALNTSTPSAAKPSQSAAVQHQHGLGGGAIAGIAVGAVVVLLLAAALCYFVGRSNTYREVIKHHRSEGAPSQTGDLPTSMPHQSPPMAHAWQDHRVSGQSAWTNMSPPGDGTSTFVGYNRHTGAPEFAAEAEAPVVQRDQKQAPLGHPAFSTTHQGTTYELAAETPVATTPPAQRSPNPAHYSPNPGSTP